MRPDWWEYIADDPADNQPRVPYDLGARFTVGLYFQDLEKGDFQMVYPQGKTASEIFALLADPGKQFDPVPPPPPPSSPPTE